MGIIEKVVSSNKYLFKEYAHKTNASLAGRIFKVVKVEDATQ